MLAELEDYAERLGLSLDSRSWALLERYSALVLEHNRKTNLTAAKTPREVALRHLADGLAAAPPLKRLLASVPNPELADVGAGAGFIGVSLQIAWPQARVTLLEANRKKFLFLNWAVAELGLPARAAWARAPDRGPWLPAGGFDAATERALAPLDEALAACLPLVKAGGYFAAFRSEKTLDGKALGAISGLSASLAQTEPYRLPGEDKDRFLIVFKKH